jgi:ribosomal protein S18 acetylase RimI-like enzyme
MRIREEIENVNTIKNSCNNISDKVFWLFIENFLVGIGKIEQMWPDYSRWNHNFHIWPLYILSEYRGRGYGRKIMEALEEYALEKINGPIVKFNLWVTEWNEIPLKLYFSMGYTIIWRDSKHIRMWEDIFLDRILMTKVIYK